MTVGIQIACTVARGTSAEMDTKSTPMPMVTMVSKNTVPRSKDVPSLLATRGAVMPMSTAARSPLSWETRLARPAVTRTDASTTCTSRVPLPRARRPPMTKSAVPIAAATTATRIPPKKIAMPSGIDVESLALMIWKTTTAASAPSGSRRVPSQTSTPRTRALGRAKSRMGLMTVGPETTRIEPSIAAIGHGMPMMKWATAAASTPVTGAPIHTSRRTTLRSLAWSLIAVRPIPPLKRMMATMKSTAVGKIGPRTAPGMSSGAMMPRRNPAGRSSTRAGIRSFGAITWQAVATPKTSTVARITCWAVGSDTAITLGARPLSDCPTARNGHAQRAGDS